MGASDYLRTQSRIAGIVQFRCCCSNLWIWLFWTCYLHFGRYRYGLCVALSKTSFSYATQKIIFFVHIYHNSICFIFFFVFLITVDDVQIAISWKAVLADEFAKPYFADIKEFLTKEKEQWHIVYPKWSNIFNAFNLTPFDKVRVVILGQDPYHGEGEAHGLCFSVQDGVRQPPSLKNIFKELQDDLWITPPVSWNLTKRAEQWVFLLNASLTVRKDEPNSHKDIGRHTFTDAVIKKISDKKDWVIFLLRWAFAQKKKVLIDISRHIVLEAPHPSPFSVHKGFFGCKHFSQVNEILRWRGEKEINRDLK